jgi:Cdc6-like AAA superfamily ATPase
MRKRETDKLLGPLVQELSRHVRTGNPLLDVALRVLSSGGVFQERNEAEEMAGSSEALGGDAAKRRFVASLLKLSSGLFLILGAKGTGKTALSARLLEMYGERGKPMFALGMGLLPPHIKELDSIEEIPNGAAVVLDDTNILFDNRSYYTTAGRLLHKLITLSRQKDIIIIANSQQSAAINRYLLQADAVFLKPQNTLVAEYERAALVRIINEAQQAFAGMSIEQARRWVYAVSVSAYVSPFAGMINYLPPSWYSTRYSKSKRGEL